MADRIKGITIELDGDTTKPSNALKGVNTEIAQRLGRNKAIVT